MSVVFLVEMLDNPISTLSASGAHAFENAITVATLILTTVCAALVTWAARRSATAQ